MRAAIASASAADTLVLSGLLPAVPCDLAWAAVDARGAAERCRADPPDVLLVSISTPLDGEALVREVMASRPCAILLSTDDPTRDVHRVYAALAAGAVDVAARPAAGVKGAELETSPLVTKLRRLRTTLGIPHRKTPSRRIRVLAIAASTGGPHALARVLEALPASLSAPVLLAQHIDEAFLPGLADWLGSCSGRHVEVATEGTALETGRILLVRSDVQPTVDDAGAVRYHPADSTNPFQPCIDTLFSSLARVPKLRGVAALLTGMGADGAAGLLALRRAGWVTLAQDAASSVVFGMPRAAAEMGAATEVVSLDDVAAAAVRALAGLGEAVMR